MTWRAATPSLQSLPNLLKEPLWRLAALLSPTTAQAFDVMTHSDATVLDEHTILFSVTYRLGFLNQSMRVPLHATAASASAPHGSVQYTVTRAGEKDAAGQAAAIVLTDDPTVTIEDAHYVLPPGKSAEFTLYTLFQPSSDRTDLYQLQIDHLPFTLIDVAGAAQLSTFPNQSPRDYQTPQVRLAPTPVTITTELIELTTRPQ